MKTVEKSVSAGFPLFSILTIIFVLAKIFGKITWSWWWVFSPLWLPFAIALTIGFVLLLAVITALLVEEIIKMVREIKRTL